LRKNIPITNKFKQTYNIFKKGNSQLFALPTAIVAHNSRLIKYRTIKKAIFSSFFSPFKNTFLSKTPLVKKKKKQILRLYANKTAYLSFAELEAARRSIKRASKKALKNKIFLRAYPFLYLTKKPSEVRMGKGKGIKLRDKVCPVNFGKTIFELRNVPKRIGIFALLLAKKKLSIPTHIVKKIYTAYHRRIRIYQNININ